MSTTMSTPYLSSPDQPSTVYPDRLIRPLPRRSIKSRLSQEAADSIAYPPNPPSTSLPSYAHYGENGDILGDGRHLTRGPGAYQVEQEVEHDHDQEHQHEHVHEHEHDHELEHEHEHDHEHDHCLHRHHHCHHDHDDDDFDSTEEASPVALRRSNSYRSSPRSPRARQQRYNGYRVKGMGAPDGYEAFENTNNKKKRKIPTSGNPGAHHSSLSNDLASMGLSPAQDSEDNQFYNGSSTLGMGMQGAGRGRNGRKSSPRNPLGVSVNGTNARAGSTKLGQPVHSSFEDGESKPNQGIISAAIANATALLRNPLGKDQENFGVLDQQTKSHSANSQFTFTCEADAKGVKFPEQSLYSSDYSQRVGSSLPMPTSTNQKFSTHGTQTSPNLPSQAHPQMPAPQHAPANSTQGKKPRRRKGDVYALAARQRKLQQEYMNLQHPPASEDIWICEFCEYESIFGEPPRALIRQYEIKDRRERKRLAEKQRLLEKAKLKGRKGKKQTKNASKAANQASQQPNGQQSYEQHQTDPLGDEYLDDGYDDDPAPAAVPPSIPPPSGKQQHRQAVYPQAGIRAGSGVVDGGGIR